MGHCICKYDLKLLTLILLSLYNVKLRIMWNGVSKLVYLRITGGYWSVLDGGKKSIMKFRKQSIKKQVISTL